MVCLVACQTQAFSAPIEATSPSVVAKAMSPLPTPTRTPPMATAAPPTATATPHLTPSLTPLPTPWPYIVVIDPGHGGKDLGARHFDDQGRMLYHESQVNLELGLLVRDELVRRGFQVVMTREGDYSVSGEDEDVNGDGVVDYTVDESQARVDIANAAHADLLLSLHQNAFYYPDGRPGRDVGGLQTFYCGDRPFSEASYHFATLVHQALLEAFADLGYAIHDRGVLDDIDLITPDSPGKHIILLGPSSERIVRPSEMPGALSEPLFITHEIEGQMARDPAVLARLARAYADAVEAYFQDAER